MLLTGAAAVVTSAGASAVSQKPKNLVRPRIVGTPKAGVSLSATPGSWRPSRHLRYKYRWLRCPVGGSKCTRIAGASRARFTPGSDDVGATLRVTVTATNDAGTARATSRASRLVQQNAGAHVAALWHMDETTGAVMHDSIGGNSGTMFHVALGAPGATGRALGFNGRNSYVSIPSASALNPGTANIVLTVSLRTTDVPAAPPADADLIRKGTYAPAASEYKVELQHSGRASCGFEGSAGYSELIAGPRLNDGKWHKIQCIKAPTAIQLVIDGKTFTQPANIGSISNTAPIIIGARPDGDYYSGLLDEASIQIG